MTPKRLLEELKGIRKDYTPVWLMRQAGRYLPEYRKLRETHDFLTMCRTPELASRVTLMPFDHFDLDAAIIFSDILIPLAPMGMKLEFHEAKGPVILNPVRTPADVDTLRVPDTDSETAFVAQAIKFVRMSLPPPAALIGFSGAPFTLAAYMAEGHGSKDFKKIRDLMNRDSETYGKLLDKVTETVIRSLDTQIKAGAEAIQIFDSWAGLLSPPDYKAFALPYTRKVIEHVAGQDVPVIHFARNAQNFLPALSETAVDALSVDWNISMEEAHKRTGGKVLQGNLDPEVLLQDQGMIREKTKEILGQCGKLKGHVFNLGHGVLPNTPPDNVKILVDCVHELSRR
jgi:uroporphyrinogen decarboxylase